MSVKEKVISYLKEQEGVVGILDMDDELSKAVDSIEKSIKTRNNHEYLSIGYDLAMERIHRVCVFYTNDFKKDFRARLKLMTSDGTVMGTNLMPEEMDEYRGREDVIWISDDFVVFPMIRGSGEEMFVMYPYEYKELHDIAPGCSNAIGFSPTPSSDSFLKEKAGIEESSFIFSTVVAFDE